MIVGHCAFTVVYDSLCLQNEAVRDDNTCMVIDNDKDCITINDGICIVISIGHPWSGIEQYMHDDRQSNTHSDHSYPDIILA